MASFLENYLGVIIDHNHVQLRSRSFRKRSDSGHISSRNGGDGLIDTLGGVGSTG